MAEQYLSQKYANYNYAPGIATYGIDGKTGQTGNDGNNIYFTDYIINDLNEDIQELLQKISKNYLPIKGIDKYINRSYKQDDIFFDRNGVVYKLLKDNIEVNYTNWQEYFTIVGKINITDDNNYFTFANGSNRLILNSSYSGYDILSNVSESQAVDYINTDAAVNIISSNVDENDNIELVRMQSIDDIDVEDGKMSVLYKTTENAFYIDANKPVVIKGDLKVVNNNNVYNEYDNFSTVLTSDDPITYFKYLCDKLNYSIVYDDQKNQYFIAIYSTENDVDKQKQTLQYIFDRNETVFGKIYAGTSENETNNIKLVKLDKNFNGEDEVYLYSYIPTNISSIISFSLIYNTEIFLTFNSRNNIELEDFDYSKYSSIKLMRYNAFYYAIFKDERVLIPDSSNYFEYTGDTVTYNNQFCYIWKQYDNGELNDDSKLLTNSLHLTLPFTTDSNEFVAYVSNGYYYYHSSQIDGNKFDNCPIKYTINTSVGEIENYTKYSISPSDFTLPSKYSGLCILEKNV